MADDGFDGLATPSVNPSSESEQPERNFVEASPAPASAPKPILKTFLKRSVPLESTVEVSVPASKKSLKFKTTKDALEAMQKISSHIKNPAKFNKASEIALQPVQAGSSSLVF